MDHAAARVAGDGVKTAAFYGGAVVLEGRYQYRDGGSYRFINDFAKTYIDDLAAKPKLTR